MVRVRILANYFDEIKGNYTRIKTITILNLENNDKSCLRFNWKSSQKGSIIDAMVQQRVDSVRRADGDTCARVEA